MLKGGGGGYANVVSPLRPERIFHQIDVIWPWRDLAPLVDSGEPTVSGVPSPLERGRTFLVLESGGTWFPSLYSGIPAIMWTVGYRSSPPPPSHEELFLLQ